MDIVEVGSGGGCGGRSVMGRVGSGRLGVAMAAAAAAAAAASEAGDRRFATSVVATIFREVIVG